MKRRLGSRGFGAVETILILIIVGIIGGAGWYVWRQSRAESPDDSTSQATPQTSEAETDDSAEPEGCEAEPGYAVYTNSGPDFCFVYPEDWGSVTLREGPVDAAYEPEGSYLGTFSANEHASFAFIPTDWEYTGPGRDGPSNATGFTEYEQFTVHDSSQPIIRFNTDEKYLVAYSTDFHFRGVVIVGQRAFESTEGYAGVEFELHVMAPDGSEFDGFTDPPSKLVSEDQLDTMEAVINSLKEL